MTREFEYHMADKEKNPAAVHRQDGHGTGHSEADNYDTKPRIPESGLSRRQTLLVLGLAASGAAATAASANVPGLLGSDDDGGSAPEPAPSFHHGGVVPVAPGLDDVIDPSRTETPVQDAVDLVADAGGGTVYLPPTSIEEADSVSLHSKTTLLGTWGRSEIVFPSGSDGLVIDPEQSAITTNENYVTHVLIDGVSLVGPGVDQPDSGVAVRDRGMWLSRFGRVELREWNGTVWLVEEDAFTFDTVFEYIYIMYCDSGDADGLIEWNSYGSTNRVSYLNAFPTQQYSGERSTLLSTRGFAARIGSINAGTAIGPVLEGFYSELSIGTVHWEPEDVTSQSPHVFHLEGDAPFSIDTLTIDQNAEAEHAYRVRSGGHVTLPIPHVADSATLHSEPLFLENDPESHIFYHGPSDEVLVDGSGETGLCHCLADFESTG